MAAKCSVRKGIIRRKINERRARSRSTVRGEKYVPQQTNIDLMRTKLPQNYLVVMAATITIADKREAEVPGVFQYIVNKMLKANGIPLVQFPKSVISGYKTEEKESAEAESKKRQQSDDTDGDERQVGYKRVEWAIMPDGTWGRITSHMTPISQSPARPPHITPSSTPAATPAPTPAATPASTPTATPAPTPANTPRTTPLPTPSSSPQRPSGAIPKTTMLCGLDQSECSP